MKKVTECSIVFKEQEGKKDNIVLTFPNEEKRKRIMHLFRSLFSSLQIRVIGDRKFSIPTEDGKVKFFLSNNGNQKKKQKEILEKLQQLPEVIVICNSVNVEVNNKRERYRNISLR